MWQNCGTVDLILVMTMGNSKQQAYIEFDFFESIRHTYRYTQHNESLLGAGSPRHRKQSRILTALTAAVCSSFCFL